MTPAERISATDAAYRRHLDWRDPETRLIWADLAIECGMGVAPPATDALDLARREGKRAIFLYMAGKVGLPLIPET